MKFSSRKDSMFITVLIAMIALGIVPSIFLDTGIFLKLVLLLPGGLFVWILISTQYELGSDKLKYKSAFLKGSIKIDCIREIIVGETLWVGTRKPATAKNGLIIKYNKYDEIYISPASNGKFVEEILKLNPHITIHN